MTLDSTNVAYNGRGTASSFDAAIVSLFDGQNLYAMALDRSPEGRASLTESLTSVFDFDLKPHESEMATDIMISLLQQAELDIRQAVAERLASSDRIPLRIALSLANDEISVARRVLQESPVLDEYDLLYIIQSKTSEYWQAMAGRAHLSASLIQTLAEKRDVDTSHALLGNARIDIPTDALSIFADMAKTSESLCIPLLHRAELPKEFAKEIYRAAHAAVRDQIVAALPDKDYIFAVDEALDDVAADLSNTASNKTDTSEKAKIYAARTLVTPTKMIEALRLGQLSYFTALLAQYTDLKTCMVETLLRQKGGRGLAIACKARKMPRSDFMTIFMLKSALSSQNRIVDHAELAQALVTFDRIQEDFAQKMMGKAVQGSENLTLVPDPA